MMNLGELQSKGGKEYIAPSEDLHRRSNILQKLSFVVELVITGLVIIAIAVISATYDKLHHLNRETVTTVYESLGLPGYEGYSWNDVLTNAAGSEVNFWSYSQATTNNWIDNWLTPQVADAFNIKIKRIPLKDTAIAVAKIAQERKMGYSLNNGSVDLVWINGENFYNAKTAGNLYGPWATKTPNSDNFAFTSPAIAYDFGHSTNGYEVWPN